MNNDNKKITEEETQTKGLTPVGMHQYETFAVNFDYTDTTPSADDFDADTEVDAAEDTITLTAHGFVTGLKGQASSTGTLPAGLSTSTDYFVIVVDEDTIQLASSLANANAGTAIDITDTGTAAATHTFTPTSLAGCSLKMQESVDGQNWVDISGQTIASITGDGNSTLQAASKCGHVRAHLTMTAGQIAFTSKYVLKG